MKNHIIIRLTSMLMFAAMLISAFASCAETTPNEETTAGALIAETQAPVLTEEVTTADPTLDAHGYLKDALPEDLKFNDEITLLVWDDVEHEELVRTILHNQAAFVSSNGISRTSIAIDKTCIWFVARIEESIAFVVNKHQSRNACIV